MIGYKGPGQYIGRDYYKQIFKLKGLNETMVAEKLGIKPDSLYKKLSGKRKITLDEVWSLIDILDLPFEIIFNKEALKKNGN